MPFQIVRNDIARVRADALVNTANPKPVIGSGVDGRLHQAAGPELLAARQELGQITPGTAAITPGFDLPAKFVIHTVGPVWRGGLFGEKQTLARCYTACLKLARDNGCQSIAFPLISAGAYGFPREKALEIAVAAIGEFLREEEMEVFLVVFDRASFGLSKSRFRRVASYIDENYVNSIGYAMGRSPRRCREDAAMPLEEVCLAPAATLEEMLRQADAGFTETLLRLIDERGWKDSRVYKQANLSRQHFSKIRNDPHYRPTKATAVALALALELDLPGILDLIGRAGYILSNSSKFDLIIRWFVEQGIYDIMEINLALYEFDQPLLGGK